jgi:Protein of unknown function (DUF3592)
MQGMRGAYVPDALILAGACFILGVVALAARSRRLGRSSEISGRVEKLTLEPVFGYGKPSFWLSPTYFVSGLVDGALVRLRLRTRRTLREGESVKVRYDPKRPHEAFLENESSGIAWLFFVLTAVFVFAAWQLNKSVG